MMRNEHTPITPDLFADQAPSTPGETEQIGQQAFVLRGFALPWLDRLLPALESVLQAAPFRQMVTPGGFTMSVALSSCGALGWTTDRSGAEGYNPGDETLGDDPTARYRQRLWSVGTEATMPVGEFVDAMDAEVKKGRIRGRRG